MPKSIPIAGPISENVEVSLLMSKLSRYLCELLTVLQQIQNCQVMHVSTCVEKSHLVMQVCSNHTWSVPFSESVTKPSERLEIRR